MLITARPKSGLGGGPYTARSDSWGIGGANHHWEQPKDLVHNRKRILAFCISGKCLLHGEAYKVQGITGISVLMEQVKNSSTCRRCQKTLFYSRNYRQHFGKDHEQQAQVLPRLEFHETQLREKMLKTRRQDNGHSASCLCDKCVMK